MNALATICLDSSVTYRFKNAAHPGERAVSGAFEFASSHPSSPRGKARAAVRSGFVGIGSLGWSNVQIVEATGAGRARAVDMLAHHLTQRSEAPNLAMADATAEQEIAFVVSLAGHPSGMLAAVTRTTNAYAFLQASSEDEQRAEEVDLTSLTRRVAR